jgi:hypothetical protein
MLINLVEQVRLYLWHEQAQRMPQQIKEMAASGHIRAAPHEPLHA